MKETTERRLRLLTPRLLTWKDNPRLIPTDERLELAMMVRSTFPEFEDYAELGMKYLGFNITEMQKDIARYMQHGPARSVIEAQRGEAKSTVAALFSVWSLVQDPCYRVLVVSAGESQASDVAILIIRLIERWPLLCWLRPDTSRGDRCSYENYDVHCELKRTDKSAAVKCLGISANLPGNRADLLLADDIESPKNSLTQPMRDQLVTWSKEFSAICSKGRIMYLGTPQNKDSVYKTLPGRGFEIRIWPGRYPNADQLERYLPGTLAPMILEAIDAQPHLMSGGGVDGTRGQPTDPIMFDEAVLLAKEIDNGPEYFDLQYMLDTSSSDALRTKLKLSDCMFGSYSADMAPEKLVYEASPRTAVQYNVPILKDSKLYGPGYCSEKYQKYAMKVLAVDPAGKGGDEVAYAAGGACGSTLHLFSVGGYPGGMTEENIKALIDVADRYDIKIIEVESNCGAGMASTMIKQHLDTLRRTDVAVNDYFATGQKEKRIIDTLGPLFRKHKFVVHQTAVESDAECCKLHPADKRNGMSVWYQLSSITYDRGCLVHDDRADCVQRVAEVCQSTLAIDDDRAAERRAADAHVAFMQNPMGIPGLNPVQITGTRSRLRR